MRSSDRRSFGGFRLFQQILDDSIHLTLLDTVHLVLMFVLAIGAMIVDIVVDIAIFLLFGFGVWGDTAPTDRTSD